MPIMMRESPIHLQRSDIVCLPPVLEVVVLIAQVVVHLGPVPAGVRHVQSVDGQLACRVDSEGRDTLLQRQVGMTEGNLSQVAEAVVDVPGGCVTQHRLTNHVKTVNLVKHTQPKAALVRAQVDEPTTRREDGIPLAHCFWCRDLEVLRVINGERDGLA